MTGTPSAQTSDGLRRAECRARHTLVHYAPARGALARGALAMLLALWLLWAPLASTSKAASTGSPCSALDGSACTSALAIAQASDSEEGEEEPETDEEEAASTEAEAEEDGSATAGSPSNHGSSRPSNPGSGPNGAVLSQLRLTAKATSALKHSRPSASTVAFSFTLSAPAKVRVTLVRQTSSHGRKRWTMLPDSLTVSAGEGRVTRNLTGHNRLSPGRYRLTAKPLTGRPRSIYLSIRS